MATKKPSTKDNGSTKKSNGALSREGLRTLEQLHTSMRRATSAPAADQYDDAGVSVALQKAQGIAAALRHASHGSNADTMTPYEWGGLAYALSDTLLELKDAAAIGRSADDSYCPQAAEPTPARAGA